MSNGLVTNNKILVSDGLVTNPELLAIIVSDG